MTITNVHQPVEMSRESENAMSEEDEKYVAENAEQEGEEREKIEWPYTKGTSRLAFRHFDLENLPEFLDEEETPEGKLIMSLISEIFYLKGSLAELVKEHQKKSFEEWLKTQGKSMRDPGSPMQVINMKRSKK